MSMASVASIPCRADDCNRGFGSTEARASHEWHEHGLGSSPGLSYPCRVNTCTAIFGSAENRDEHMRDVHKPGRAPTVGSAPSTTVRQVVHAEAVHPVKESIVPGAFVCDQPDCGASFDTNSKLGTHRWSRHRIHATKPKRRPPSMVDRLLADEDETVTIELRESLAKRLLDIVLTYGVGVHLDFTDPASLRREADRLELEQAVKAAVDA